MAERDEREEELDKMMDEDFDVSVDTEDVDTVDEEGSNSSAPSPGASKESNSSDLSGVLELSKDEIEEAANSNGGNSGIPINPKPANGLKITKVNFYETNSRVVFANVTFNGIFKVRGFRVIEQNGGGIFVGMPSRYDEDNDEYRDNAHPVEKEGRVHVEGVIKKAYERWYENNKM